MATTKEDMRNITKEALKPVQEQIPELLEKDWSNYTINGAINELGEKFDQKCQEYDQKISGVLKNHIDLVDSGDKTIA